jgi:Xaa-Pro aminopeptidase
VVAPPIGPAEFRLRQQRAGRAASERGLAGLVAFSRGGGTLDRLADVFWLTGFVPNQPFVPDLAGHWRAAGHAAVVLPVDGEATLVVDSERLPSAPTADATVVSADPIGAAARLLAQGLAAPARGRPTRIGVLGADALTAGWAADLRSGCPGVELEAVDELGYALRRVKSPAEQALLREAGRIGGLATRAALEAAVPGATEADVASTCIAAIARAGGALYDVVLSSGPGWDSLAPSGGGAGAAGWTTRRLERGELLRLDAYGSVGGYLFDLARSVVVGDQPDVEQAELIGALREAVEAGTRELRPGVRLSAVAQHCDEVLAASAHAKRHGVPAHLMDGFWGHGLGLGFEPPWIGPDSDEVVQEGWCLALERRAAVPGLGGAQHEDTILVTPKGPELLTGLADAA